MKAILLESNKISGVCINTIITICVFVAIYLAASYFYRANKTNYLRKESFISSNGDVASKLTRNKYL